MEAFPKNEFTEEHDRLFPKRGVDLQFEKLVSSEHMDTLDVVSTTARLITRMKPMEAEEFKMIVDEYIDLRIKRKEFSKALYYSYTALVDCLKDTQNQEKQSKKNKILDYITLCAKNMKGENLG